MSKNIKSSTFEKISKSSHFRFDVQRQISLDLNHTCRIRKRLINLINFAIFFEIIRLARCEYNKLVVCTISLHLVKDHVKMCLYLKKDVLIFEKKCACIQRNVFVLLFYYYVFYHLYLLTNYELELFEQQQSFINDLEII